MLKHIKSLVLLAILSVFLYSCKDDSNTSISNKTNIPSPTYSLPSLYDSIGIKHNIMLSDHFDLMHPHTYDCIGFFALDYNGNRYEKKSYIDSTWFHISQKAIQRGYGTSTEMMQAKMRFDSLMYLSGMYENVDGVTVYNDLRVKINSFISVSRSKGYLNNDEYNLLVPILAAYQNNNGLLVDSLMNNIDLQNLNEQDYKAIFVLKGIYHHSMEFWANHKGITLSRPNSKSNSSQTVNKYAQVAIDGLADGVVGGVIGAGSFGAGAIVGGALGSAGADWLTDVLDNWINSQLNGCCCGTNCGC